MHTSYRTPTGGSTNSTVTRNNRREASIKTVVSTSTRGGDVLISMTNQANLIRTPPSSNSTKNSAKTKLDDLFKRIQTHTIVQTYEKAMNVLKLEAVVVVNGVTLQAVVSERGSLRAKWEAQQELAANTQSMRSTTVSSSGRNLPHYARCLEFEPTELSLSLDTWKTLEVILSSSTSPITTSFHSTTAEYTPTKLTKKSWRLVAETDRKIGLALYELQIGSWNGSTLMALTWTNSLEVVRIYVQLHMTEMLYTCPPRAIRILTDDVDAKYGLHSYTSSLTLRDLDGKSFWETECYAIEFPTPAKSGKVSVDLLDTVNAHRDRGRFTSNTPALFVMTDAISYAMENVVIVDFDLWDASCTPIWGFSKPLVITPSSTQRNQSTDLSISCAGEQRQLFEVQFRDPIKCTGNAVTIQLEKTKFKTVFVQQITLELSLAFIDRTFKTTYGTKRD